jgi:hypothetical protein
MKKTQLSLVLLISLGVIACSDETSDVISNESTVSAEASTFSDGPESTKSSNWQYVINNAKRTINEYATERNPNAVFIGKNLQVDFIRQYGGKHEGRYMLKVVNDHGGNTSFAMLLPLFDENASSIDLDDESQLWQVVEAKFNGHNF